MLNIITKDTWEIWAENIEYLITHVEDEDKLTYLILRYLEDEGAFTVKD